MDELSRYLIRVRYPLSAVEFREERLLFVSQKKNRATIESILRIVQRLGQGWPALTLIYETSPRGFTILSPPPFRPWYVDTPPVRLLRGTVKLPEMRSATVEPTLWGKRYRLRIPELAPGSPRFLHLERRSFPAALRVEIPAYHLPRAFLGLSLIPDTYFPPGRSRIFLDGRELPPRDLPALNPGTEVNLYLGEDPWVTVEKEVLKDYEEKVGMVKRRLRRTLEWRILVKSSHPRSISAVLYERIPVSRKEEIRVRASAEPPWDERSPEGRVLWRFELSPGESHRFKVRVVIERPAS